jgi:hypothetical protein
MNKEEKQMRVRYGRLEDRSPKNTLVTIKKDNFVYFGIARCNSKLDTFYKSIGTHIAEQRAQLAVSDIGMYSYHDGIEIHRSGVRGNTEVENIKSLISYFENIDEHMLKRMNGGD